MLPTAAFPMNDPDGLLFPQLRAITPDLKQLFRTVTVSVPLQTQQDLPHEIAWLKSEPFYHAVYYERSLAVGEDFLTLYDTAARNALPDEIVHLFYIDRVAYALQSEHRWQFLADIRGLPTQEAPIIFERSRRAWQTHPANYVEIERLVSTAAKWAFGRPLDYCWCHIALPAGRLLSIIPTVRRRDMAHVAEYILPIRDVVRTRRVDWLAWEDPFILDRDAADLKREREQSAAETGKRLAYAIPMMQMIMECARDGARSVESP